MKTFSDSPLTEGNYTETFAVRVYKQYFNFGSAHFLIFGDGSREELHGHNYKVEVMVEGDTIAGDLVLDFIQFKPIVKALCDELDHRTLLPLRNPNLDVTTDGMTVTARHRDGSVFMLPARDVNLLDITNTSTEMLARYIALRVIDGVRAKIPNARIRTLEISVEESPGQCGIYRVAVNA